MSNAPEISTSGIEERRAYVKERFPCIADAICAGFALSFTARTLSRRIMIILRGGGHLRMYRRIIRGSCAARPGGNRTGTPRPHYVNNYDKGSDPVSCLR